MVTTAGLLVQQADHEWGPFTLGIGPSEAFCAALRFDRREELRAACFERLGSPAGSFALPARAWRVRGRAPTATQ